MDMAVFVLAVFHDGYQGAAYRQSRAVQRMHQFRLAGSSDRRILSVFLLFPNSFHFTRLLMK